MSDTFEQLHPRANDGRFEAKGITEATGGLEALSLFGPSVRQAMVTELDEARDRLVTDVERAREQVEQAQLVLDQAERELRAFDETTEQVRGALTGDLHPPAALDGGPQQTQYRGPEHVDDEVIVDGYGTFHRSRGGVYPADAQFLRVQVGRELSPDDAQQLARLVGYDWAKTGGERLGDPHQDAPNSIIVFADTTKCRGDRIAEFGIDVDNTIYDGSPVRTTDRAGTGTRGTRLVEGLKSLQ